MSKLYNRDAIKNLSNLHVDCQYAYQIGTRLVNNENIAAEEYDELCGHFRRICDDITDELESVKMLLPAK
jgi:hypothetical protein